MIRCASPQGSLPVHPTLARVLAEWKLAGWERTHGRQPSDDDLVVPTRNGTERTRQEAPKALRLDLDALTVRARRGHDLRRTFITLAQVDGARRDLLETVTHGPRGDIVSLYTTFPWPALCAEIAKLKIELREGELLTLPTEPMHPSRYTAVTGAERARRRWRFPVTPSGIEAGPNVTGRRSVAVAPTEGSAVERPAVMVRCNERNETLGAASAAITAARRLALVAQNALINGDLRRAQAALRNLHDTTIGGGTLPQLTLAPFRS